MVADTARDSGHEDIVIDSIEEFLEVEIDDKLAPLLGYIFPGLFQSHMSAPSLPKTIAGVGKGRVEDGFQHLENRLLNHAIDHHWNAQLAFASVRLLELDSSYGKGLVSPVQ